MRVTKRWLGVGLVSLGVAIAVCALLGPLVLDIIAYRASGDSLNQIVGGDAVGLLLVAPSCIMLGVMVLRRRPGAALLALAPALFATYTYAQLILGNEYLTLAGNVERFLPLLLAVFVLAAVCTLGAWSVANGQPLPPSSTRADRVAGVVLLTIAAFLLFGLHLPSYLNTLADSPTSIGLLSSPTSFWVVKFMDLGIITPAAVVVGVGMLRGAPWARRPMYAIVGAYAFLGVSVAAMTAIMLVTGDPNSSLASLLVASIIATIMVSVASYVYRPLLPGVHLTVV